MLKHRTTCNQRLRIRLFWCFFHERRALVSSLAGWPSAIIETVLRRSDQTICALAAVDVCVRNSMHLILSDCQSCLGSVIGRASILCRIINGFACLSARKEAMNVSDIAVALCCINSAPTRHRPAQTFNWLDGHGYLINHYVQGFDILTTPTTRTCAPKRACLGNTNTPTCRTTKKPSDACKMLRYPHDGRSSACCPTSIHPPPTHSSHNMLWLTALSE